jgi:hypothetical protein
MIREKVTKKFQGYNEYIAVNHAQSRTRMTVSFFEGFY